MLEPKIAPSVTRRGDCSFGPSLEWQALPVVGESRRPALAGRWLLAAGLALLAIGAVAAVLAS